MNLGNPTDQSSFILEQPFVEAACPFDYVLVTFRFDSLNLSLQGNSIDN